MAMTDALFTALACTGAGAALYLAYRQDMREMRYFAAMRRAATVPRENREWHRRFALRHGLFWRPCPLCSRPFGGHEMTGKTIPHPDPGRAVRGERLPVCPVCSATLRPPGTSSKEYQGKAFRRRAKG